MAQLKNNTFESPYGSLRIEMGTYSNGQPKVQLWVKEEEGFSSPCGSLSTSIDCSEELAPGEFLAKTWEENEEIAAAALQSGLFEDTGKRVQSGFVEAPIWKMVYAP